LTVIRDIKSHYDWHEWLKTHGLDDRQIGATDITMSSNNTLQEDYDTLEGNHDALEGNHDALAAETLDQTEIETLIDNRATSESEVLTIVNNNRSETWLETIQNINYVFDSGSPPPSGTGSSFHDEWCLDEINDKLYHWNGSSWDSGVDVEDGDKFIWYIDGIDSSGDSGDYSANWVVVEYENGSYSDIAFSGYEGKYFEILGNNNAYTIRGGYPLPISFNSGSGFYNLDFFETITVHVSGFQAMQDPEGVGTEFYLPIQSGYRAELVGTKIHLDQVLNDVTGLDFNMTINGANSPYGGFSNLGHIDVLQQYGGLIWRPVDYRSYVFGSADRVGFGYVNLYADYSPGNPPGPYPLKVHAKLSFIIRPAWEGE